MPGDAREVFDAIAESWHSIRTRQKFLFPKWFWMFNAAWKGGRVLDIGCGNCKNLVYLRGLEMHGMDFSRKMIKSGKMHNDKRGFEIRYVVGDAHSLPYKDGSFDHVLATALYHHLEKDRQNALLELFRILRPGGEAFVTVWYRWKDRFLLRKRDITVPWTTHGRTYSRYYHLFSFKEIRNLIREAGLAIVKEGSENGWKRTDRLFARNACFLVRKPGFATGDPGRIRSGA